MAKSKSKLPKSLIHEFVDAAHYDAEVPKLDAMLKKHPALLTANRGGSDPENAMGAALHMRATKVIDFLVSKGAEVDAFVACALGQKKKVKAMLADNPKLATASNKHSHGIPIIGFAANPAICELLIDHGHPVDIVAAARYGLVKRVKQFLADDPDSVYETDERQQTALHHSILCAHDSISKLLIDADADVDATDFRNATPLTNACQYGRHKVAKWILEYDINMNNKAYSDEWSYLHLCCYWKSRSSRLTPAEYEAAIHKIIRMLIKEGIDCDLKCKKGKTALDYCNEKDLPERAALIQKLSPTAR